MLRMASADRSTSSADVRKLETEIRIAARPCQSVAPSQQVPSACTRLTTSRVVSSSSSKRTRTWLRTTSLRISTRGCAPSTDAKVQGVRRLNELIAAEPRVSATTIQTVGLKGYDGFAVAVVLAGG